MHEGWKKCETLETVQLFFATCGKANKQVMESLHQLFWLG